MWLKMAYCNYTERLVIDCVVEKFFRNDYAHVEFHGIQVWRNLVENILNDFLC